MLKCYIINIMLNKINNISYLLKLKGSANADPYYYKKLKKDFLTVILTIIRLYLHISFAFLRFQF
jgi:hypothetical protein